MKRLAFVLVAFISVFLIGNVNADSNSVKARLSCPTTVNLSQTFKCDVLVKTIGNDVISVQNVISNSNSYAQILKGTMDPNNFDLNRERKAGEVSIKAGKKGGIAKVSVSFDVKFAEGSPTWQKGISIAAIINIGNPNNDLTNIKINGVQVPGFDANNKNYVIESEDNEAVITAITASTKATVEGTGTKKLLCGSNSYILTVTAENNTVKRYKVVINRKCNSNANLKDIKISSGVLSPTFSANTYSYTVKVGKSISKISIDAIKENSTQKIKGEVKDAVLKYGENEFEIKVTSQSGSKKTYKITVEREKNDNKNLMLKSLSISDMNIEFSPEVFEYNGKVLYPIEKLTVLAVPNDEETTVTIKGQNDLKIGNNIITIELKDKNGDTNYYKVNVYRLEKGKTLGDNANIKNIVIKDSKFVFDYNKRDYKLFVGSKEKLEIKVEMEDPNATYRIEGNSDLRDGDIIYIYTTSLDGTKTEKYQIEVTKSNYTAFYIIGGIIAFVLVSIPVAIYFRNYNNVKTSKTPNNNPYGSGERINLTSNIPTELTNNNKPVTNSVAANNINNSINSNNSNINNNPVNNVNNNNVEINKNAQNNIANNARKEPIDNTNNNIQNSVQNNSIKKPEAISEKKPVNNNTKPKFSLFKSKKSAKNRNNIDLDSGLQNYNPNSKENNKKRKKHN